MSLVLWIILFLISSIWWKWIISWGGADQLVGLGAKITIASFADHWSEEQIKFYAVLMWVVQGMWFLLGVFVPDARIYVYPSH